MQLALFSFLLVVPLVAAVSPLTDEVQESCVEEEPDFLDTLPTICSTSIERGMKAIDKCLDLDEFSVGLEPKCVYCEIVVHKWEGVINAACSTAHHLPVVYKERHKEFAEYVHKLCDKKGASMLETILFCVGLAFVMLFIVFSLAKISTPS